VHRSPSFGQGEIKMCILGILFREGEVSANKILLLLPRTQASERLKMFLTQLEEKGKIKILDRDNMCKGLNIHDNSIWQGNSAELSAISVYVI
jgi:hypothetical protein